MAKRYLDVVIVAFSQRTEWQLILACGPFYESLRGGTIPPNIHLFARVPQLEVLEQVDLTITWGGAGTIRNVQVLGSRCWSSRRGEINSETQPELFPTIWECAETFCA